MENLRDWQKAVHADDRKYIGILKSPRQGGTHIALKQLFSYSIGLYVTQSVRQCRSAQEQFESLVKEQGWNMVASEENKVKYLPGVMSQEVSFIPINRYETWMRGVNLTPRIEIFDEVAPGDLLFNSDADKVIYVYTIPPGLEEDFSLYCVNSETYSKFTHDNSTVFLERMR